MQAISRTRLVIDDLRAEAQRLTVTKEKTALPRHGDDHLVRLLNRSTVLGHRCVTGELALGTVRNRTGILSLLRRHPQAVLAEHDEVLRTDDRRLHGRGIRYVDAQLLAA